MLTARFPGTCALTGTRFPAGTTIRKCPGGWTHLPLAQAAPVRTQTQTLAPTTYQPKGTKEALCALYARQDWTADYSDDPAPGRRAAVFEETCIRPEEVACAAAGIDFRPIRRWYVAKAFGNLADQQDAERVMGGTP